MNESKKSKVSVTPRWEEFMCGFISGFTNITITFPLHKTMFRQMLYGVPVQKAVSQLKKEGLHNLFRGVGPPLCQRSVQTALMFGNYDFFGSLIRDRYPSINADLSRPMAAALAGMVEVCYTQPFERVQTLLQDRMYQHKFQNTLHACKVIYKTHGPTEFFRGTTPVAVRNVVGTVIFFSAKEKTAASLPKYEGILKYLNQFVSGGLIGATNSTLLYPLNVVKTKMQSRVGGNFESPISVFRALLRERGRFISLYRGAHLNFTRSLLSWGIVNMMYETTKETIDKLRDASENDES